MILIPIDECFGKIFLICDGSSAICLWVSGDDSIKSGWDDAFDNTGYIPGAEQQPAIWAKAAAAFRDSWRSRRGLVLEGRGKGRVAH